MMKIKQSSSLVLSLLLLTLAQLHVSQAQNAPQDFLDPHTAARAAVSVGPLTWNTTIEGYAATYAATRANDCKLIHSGGPYGENIFWGKGVGYTDAAKAVELWVNEKYDYDYNTNTCSSGKVCGHYTQVVWKKSLELGCARVTCKNDVAAVFIICNYNPPGNYIGQKPY